MLLLSETKFILLGDFFQLNPPANYWAGQELRGNKFGGSRLLHTMADGNILHMNVCRRSSGGLFKFYTAMYPTGNLGNFNVRELVELSKQAFPKKIGNARWNLVVSHAKRQHINRVCWLNESRGKELLKCNLSDEIVDKIFVGCPVIGNTTEKNRTTNGAFYVVKGWDTETLFLEDLETQEFIDIPIKCTKNLRLGWSITYHAVQSRTLRDHVRLHDCNHPRFTVRHLAMGLGRAVAPELVDIA